MVSKDSLVLDHGDMSSVQMGFWGMHYLTAHVISRSRVHPNRVGLLLNWHYNSSIVKLTIFVMVTYFNTLRVGHVKINMIVFGQMLHGLRVSR